MEAQFRSKDSAIRVVVGTGHNAPPAPEPDPAWILDAVRRQAGEIVADAQRAAAETQAEAAFAAQAAGEAAPRQAERITAEAEEYSDTALRQAAAIIADSRGRAAVIAASIIADAREQADQIVTDARLRAARPDSRERHLAVTDTGLCTYTSRVLKLSLECLAGPGTHRMGAPELAVDASLDAVRVRLHASAGS